MSETTVKFKSGKLVSGIVYPEFFPINANEEVLNLGCGDGVQAVIYKGNFKRMVGVDVNQNRLQTAVALCRERGVNGFEPVAGDVEHVPLSDQFDKIIAIDIVEHLLHPEQMAGEMYRLLKPGGLALVTFPAMHDRWVALFRFIGRKILRRKGKTVEHEGWHPDDHQRELSVAKWIPIIESGGLKYVASRATTMFPPLHLAGVPRFWFTNRLVHSIDRAVCRVPGIKNLGQTVMCIFEKPQ